MSVGAGSVRKKDVMSSTIPANELTLMQELSRNPEKTQRELSSRVGLSLGMTNLLIQRLVRKGYLKVQQLDWNKTRYLLTIKGSVEKARKSYAYALHTLKQARLVTRAIQEAVLAEYRAGLRAATIVAWPETAALIQGALAERDLPGLAIDYVDGFKFARGKTGVIFTATVETPPEPEPGQRFVPLLERVDLEFAFDANPWITS